MSGHEPHFYFAVSQLLRDRTGISFGTVPTVFGISFLEVRLRIVVDTTHLSWEDRDVI